MKAQNSQDEVQVWGGRVPFITLGAGWASIPTLKRLPPHFIQV